MGERDIERAKRVHQNVNENRAKNTVLFIGDGMSLATSVAGRILIGQQSPGASGEEHVTAIDKFPHVGLVKTYNGRRRRQRSNL